MENRFGLKDLVLVLLLLVILASVWIAMKQFDRQHTQMVQLVEQVKQITAAQARTERAVGRVQGAVERGVRLADPEAGGGVDASAAAVADQGNPFARIEAAQAEPDYAEGDWVIDAFGASVGRITPYISGDAYGNAIIDRVVETLATRDPETLEWSPLLAESWTTQDNTKVWNAYVENRRAVPLERHEVENEPAYLAFDDDQQRERYVTERLEEGRRLDDIANETGAPSANAFEFTIRRGLTFSDGEPLDAHDVAFTYRLIMDPQIDAPRYRKGLSDIVKDIVAVDDYTVRATFKKPYFEAFETVASLPILPEHFYGPLEAREINEKPGLLLGSGPYRMTSPTAWVPGQPLALVRNERYWGGVPTFDRLVYQEITNDVARLTAFRNGEIDMLSTMPEQYVKLIDEPELLQRSQHFEYERPVGGYGFLAWNQRRGGQPTRFADRRVRQAMTMIVPRSEIWNNVLLGYGFGVTGPFNRLSQQYNQDLEPWPEDVGRARDLLKEAGYEDRDGDGVIEDTEGRPFEFKYTFPSGSGFWDPVVLLVRDAFAAAGIKVVPDPLEWSVFAEKLKNRDFDAISLAWSAGIESDIRQMFHSEMIADQADNFMSYANPDLDRIIDTARLTLDEDERMELWRQAHAIIHEDQPYTFLYSRKSLMFIDDRFENVEQVKVGLNDRTEWYVPAAIQKY